MKHLSKKVKNRLEAFLVCLLVFVFITLISRGFDYFFTFDKERIRWILTMMIFAGFIALLPKR